MSFEDSEKTSRVTLQQHYNFVMNQAVSITYDLWHIIFMKILLIEDNQRTQEWVTQGLSEAGYVIDAVSDGRDGLYLALKDDYALIILDIMLPGMDGWQILQTLRTAKQTPVICLTARDSVDDRVRGLDSGANDYLVKPFSFSELLARVRAQLRQHHALNSSLEISGLRMDSVSQSVSRDNISITLTRKEFQLLWLLASRAGEIIPRTVIASEIWGINFDSDTNTVDVAIRRLRAKVDDPFPEKLISTIRGMGYSFVAVKNNEKIIYNRPFNLAFILLLFVAGAGIVWTLYNGLASELKWRDDTTLINRTAQIKQLLIDGVNPDTLPVYFNRMMDVSQDILIIHGDGINKIVNRTNVSNGMLNNIPASETISAAGIYRSIINDTEIDALRINIDEVSPSLTVTVAKLASARHNMLEQYKINSIIICIVAIILCSVLSPLLIRTGLREIKKLSGVTEALNYNDSREPVEVSALPRELKPLGQALNKMHQALVKDFERLSQFADDLAHELRTPINALLGQNQVTLSQTRSIAEYQKQLPETLKSWKIFRD